MSILKTPQVSTHSRLKAAAQSAVALFNFKVVSTHSRLKAAVLKTPQEIIHDLFQHTAA